MRAATDVLIRLRRIACGNPIAAIVVDHVVDVIDALVMTSSVMLAVGLVACIEPARRALRIQPTDALKEA